MTDHASGVLYLRARGFQRCPRRHKLQHHRNFARDSCKQCKVMVELAHMLATKDGELKDAHQFHPAVAAKRA